MKLDFVPTHKYDEGIFDNTGNYDLYLMAVFCINNQNMTNKEICDYLYDYAQAHNIKEKTGFNFVHDRIRYFRNAIIDCIDGLDCSHGAIDFRPPFNSLKPKSCSFRHYDMGVKVFSKYLKVFTDGIKKEVDKKIVPAPSRNIAAIKLAQGSISVDTTQQRINMLEQTLNEFKETYHNQKHSCNCQCNTDNAEPFIDYKDQIKSMALEIKELKSEKVALEKKALRYARQYREIENLAKEATFIKPYDDSIMKSVKYDRTLIVTLTDVHYGMVATDNDGNVCYSPKICNNRLIEYAQKIINMADEKDAQKIVVCLLGDIVHGDIHGGQVGEVEFGFQSPTTQAYHFSINFARFMECLAHNVPEVDYYAVAGNHDRIHRQKDANTHDNNYTNIVIGYLKGLLAPLNNVKFCNEGQSEIKFAGSTDHQTFSVYGKTFELCHGDGEGKNMRSATNAHARNGKIIDFSLKGHVHNGSHEQFGLNNTIVAGSFCNPDLYSKKFGGHKASQTIITLENGNKGFELTEIVF